MFLRNLKNWVLFPLWNISFSPEYFTYTINIRVQKATRNNYMRYQIIHNKNI